MKTIMIDGIEYAPKKPELDGEYVLIRSTHAGVFAGILAKRVGQEADLRDVRRIWYWKGAKTLSDLALRGPACPTECKFSEPLERQTVLEVIEVIPCTVEARKAIEEVKPWKME